MKRLSVLVVAGLYLALTGCASSEKKAETVPVAETAPVAAPAAAPVDPAHTQHASHDHVHGAKCGHKAVKHGTHTDYIHDGHYHATHEGHVDDHGLLKGSKDACVMHASHDHKHGKNCGHESVRHDNHVDYLHDGHLHAVHADHVDEHGIN